MRYAVKAEADKKTVELDIYDDIGEGGFFFEAVSAKHVRRFLLENKGAEIINLRINSQGGSVLEGFAIYNLLAQHPATVVARVDGLAASIASLVLMAADEVVMGANARIMIHNPSAGLRGESDDLRRVADLLDGMRDDMVAAYAARTGLDREKIVAMMDAETWLTAKDAKRLKFADKVVPIKAGAKAKFAASLRASDLDDYSNVPEDLIAEVRNFEPRAEDATFTGVEDSDGPEIEVVVEDEGMNEEQIQALVAQSVAAALAARDTADAEARARAEAEQTASAQSAAFGARVTAALEAAVSANAWRNDDASRARFVALAANEAALTALVAECTQRSPIVPTAPITHQAPNTGKPVISAHVREYAAKHGWDPEKLFPEGK